MNSNSGSISPLFIFFSNQLWKRILAARSSLFKLMQHCYSNGRSWIGLVSMNPYPNETSVSCTCLNYLRRIISDRAQISLTFSSARTFHCTSCTSSPNETFTMKSPLYSLQRKEMKTASERQTCGSRDTCLRNTFPEHESCLTTTYEPTTGNRLQTNTPTLTFICARRMRNQ